MRVGWLADNAQVQGGAELTQAEFRAATPDGVEIVDCPAGAVDDSCDRYVLHNIVGYDMEDLVPLTTAPVVKYNHDVGPWIGRDIRGWLERNARQVCCSPIQAEHMALKDARCIPPPIDLERFAQAGAKVNGSRAGSVSVGSWRNYGKAPHKAYEYDPSVEFFGSGPLAPQGSVEVAYDDMPDLLARYQRFIFLPTVLEPFGRLVAEAWSAGCEIVTNELVGAGYWIRENPDAIETAADDFWAEVLRD